MSERGAGIVGGVEYGVGNRSVRESGVERSAGIVGGAERSRRIVGEFDGGSVGRRGFLTGHDHSLQVLEPTPESKGTRQIISGAAAKTVAAEPKLNPGGSGHPALFENYHELGFMVMDLTTSAVDLEVVTVDLADGAATEAFTRRLT